MKTQLAQDKAPFITLQGRRHKLLSMQPQEYKICHSSSPQPSSNSFPICTSNTVLLCRSFYSVNCKSATQLLFKSRLYIYFIFLKDPSLPFSDLRCVRCFLFDEIYKIFSQASNCFQNDRLHF